MIVSATKCFTCCWQLGKSAMQAAYFLLLAREFYHAHFQMNFPAPFHMYHLTTSGFHSASHPNRLEFVPAFLHFRSTCSCQCPLSRLTLSVNCCAFGFEPFPGVVLIAFHSLSAIQYYLFIK